MPCRWNESGLRDFAGRVRCRRRFGAPRQIDSHECVWLTFAGADALAEVWLNERFLGRHEGPRDSFEFEVTSLLQMHNELTVEVESACAEGGLWGEVALEVRCHAFLRALGLWSSFRGETARLQVAGEVVGSSKLPLELYVVLDRSTIAYVPVAAATAGQPFNLVSDALSPQQTNTSQSPHRVRIDLVCGGVLWYSFEQEFDFEEKRRATPAEDR
jgi:hypothetical protein